MLERKKEPKKFKMESPIGTIASECGNHFIDIISVVGVIAFVYIGKKLIGKLFGKSKS